MIVKIKFILYHSRTSYQVILYSYFLLHLFSYYINRKQSSCEKKKETQYSIRNYFYFVSSTPTSRCFIRTCRIPTDCIVSFHLIDSRCFRRHAANWLRKNHVDQSVRSLGLFPSAIENLATQHNFFPQAFTWVLYYNP